MSSATNAMPLWLADGAAIELQRLLIPVCGRVAIAGSVRRRLQVCGDIELVAVPKFEEATLPGKLLPEPVDRLSEMMAVVAKGDLPLLRRPQSPPGRNAPPWGPRYKKLVWRHGSRWLPVDLWITDKSRFGAIFALRTGSADFSRILVTKRTKGGAMPDRMRQMHGALCSLSGVDGETGQVEYTPLYTPEEADYFKLLGLPLLNPEERTEANLRRLLAQPAIQ